jgi:hypothetical protein
VRLSVDEVDVAAFDRGATLDVRHRVAFGEHGALEPRDEAQLADRGFRARASWHVSGYHLSACRSPYYVAIWMAGSL